MDKQIHKVKQPNYKKIYTDILIKYPEKGHKCKAIINKEKLSFLDIIALNQYIFGNHTDKNTLAFNQRHRAYDVSTIKEILKYQQINNLNNTQVALHFKLSRNTIAKWKKILLV